MAGLSEERVDEVGPSLDPPEPGADDGLELAGGGGGVVSQAAGAREPVSRPGQTAAENSELVPGT